MEAKRRAIKSIHQAVNELFNATSLFSLSGNQPIIINKFILPPPKQPALFDNKTMKKIYK